MKEMILILGVTASGKGKLAFELAKNYGAEIISVDSMKVYKRMNIGTAKPPVEARKQVKYHLIDVVEPYEPFSVAQFLELAQIAIDEIKAANKPVIAVGGTALYIKTLLYGLFKGPGSDEKIREKLNSIAESEGIEKLYTMLKQCDPESAERIHLNDKKRIIRALEVYQLTGKTISSFQKQWKDDTEKPNEIRDCDWKVIGIRREKHLENKRLNARVKKMIEQSLVEEVESLIDEHQPLSEQARCAIGYAEIIAHLRGKLKLEQAIEMIKKNTRRLAKHQRTWFKRFDFVNWIDIEEHQTPEQILAKVTNFIGSTNGYG